MHAEAVFLATSISKSIILAVLHMSALAVIMIEPAAATLVALRAGSSHFTTAGRITLAALMMPVL